MRLTYLKRIWERQEKDGEWILDMGDGRHILEDDSVDDVRHTSRYRPAHEGNNNPKLSDTISGTPAQEKIRWKKLSNTHAFSGQPPLDPSFYIELLSQVKVPLSILEIAQISPEAALNWKRLMTWKNSRKKKNAGMEGNSVEVEDNLLEELYFFLRSRAEVNKSTPQVNPLADRPFRIPVLVNAYKLGKLFQVKLKAGTTQADQGSDINIISDMLAKDIRIKPINIGPQKVLTMGTANRGTTQLHQYAEIKICVEDIWRTIQVFVRPPTVDDRPSLILGLPWLYDVNADIKIIKFQLKIWNRSKGEERKTIQTSDFKLAAHHKLSLILLTSKSHNLLRALPVKSKPPLESSSEIEDSESSADESISEN
ncbi:hypothetical protein K3495_g1091 [Podosphaera aphanis]|nr:hypothetical protein K3495_g1091 [Podosphaera aphanis]